MKLCIPVSATVLFLSVGGAALAADDACQAVSGQTQAKIDAIKQAYDAKFAVQSIAPADRRRPA
jgi:hypothetical protein